jgi:titin
MKVFYRLNGVNSADSAAYTLSGTTPTNLATTTFNFLSVSKSATTTLEAGAVYTSGTKGARLSRLATVITYVVAPTIAPTNVTAVASISPTRAVVSWTSTSSDITGFSIEKSTDGISFAVATTTASFLRSYSDTAVTSSTTYYYRVRSVNQAGYSPYSATTSVTMP